ncbi:hypothetical protein [Sphingomonas fuzhouensis]|uniref:hypothetical protein n=1 Tax=Sphingomonas fuzhouensis TaxID=3106033 RepID=UPI002B002613|nr:hypothetical protein [Sphingomonas sp. SGZ-02]
MITPPPVTTVAQLRQRERHLLAVLRCLTVLALILFVPSALRYHLNFSSYAPGVLAGCLMVTILGPVGVFGRIPLRVLNPGWLLGLLTLSVIAIHLGLSLFQFPVDMSRAVFSLAALALMATAVPIIFYTIFCADDAVLSDTLHIVRVSLLVMVVLSILNYQPPGPLASERPVWPFTEPSHFALTAMPFFIDAAVRSSRLMRWAWLGVVALIVLLLKSLSLSVGLVIMAICSLGPAELIAFLIAGIVGLQFIDLSYYTQRLDISYTSTNLSALVYLQGTELIQEALEKTHGWGIALQQLGFAPTNVLATEMIRRVGGGEQNLADGSFLAVKFGAEFGILGLAILLIYLVKLVGVIIDLRLVAGRRALAPVAVTFAFCVYASFFVELFVRGIGYFSGTFTMACASLGVVAVVKFLPRVRNTQASTLSHVG